MRRIACTFAVAALVACAKSTGNVVTDRPSDDCNALVNALADAFARCGYDRAQYYGVELTAIADGDCNTILSVRDHDALVDTCIPSLKDISCTELNAHHLDPTCLLQLRKSQ